MITSSNTSRAAIETSKRASVIPTKFLKSKYDYFTSEFAGELVPLMYPNLVLWLRSDKGVTVDSDGFVSSWSDQSGSGNTITASSTARPAFIPNILGGFPIVQFDGTNDVMSKVSFQPYTLSDITVFLVLTFRADNNVRGVFSMSDGSDDTACMAMYGSNGSQPSNWNSLVVEGTKGTGATDLITDSIAYGTYRILVLNYNSSSTDLIVNNVAQGTRTTNSNIINVGTLRVGSRYLLGTATQFGNINLSEMMIYNGIVGSDGYTKITDYLNSKYEVF